MQITPQRNAAQGALDTQASFSTCIVSVLSQLRTHALLRSIYVDVCLDGCGDPLGLLDRYSPTVFTSNLITASVHESLRALPTLQEFTVELPIITDRARDSNWWMAQLRGRLRVPYLKARVDVVVRPVDR